MRSVTLAVALALAALAVVAPAANATDWCMNRGQYVDVAGQAYVTLDPWFGTVLPVVWVYVETNGVSDLQRGGANLFGDVDPCQDYADHDTAVW